MIERFFKKGKEKKRQDGGKRGGDKGRGLVVK